MSTLVIDKKEYVVLTKKEYESLRVRAAAKTALAQKLTLSQGKKMAYGLIDRWAKEK